MPTRTLPAGFAGADAPARWPPPRGRPRPEALLLGVESLPGVGKGLAQKLARIGLRTLGDLTRHVPRGYQLPVAVQRIDDVSGSDEIAVAGVIRSLSSRRVRGRLTIQKAIVEDDSGSLVAVWFNQDWLRGRLPSGTPVRLRGILKHGDLNVRSFDADDEAESTADFAPIYPLTEDLNAKRLRELVLEALPRDLYDPLPAALKTAEGMPSRIDALWALHRPASREEAEAGRQRLAFDELLELQIGIARRRREAEQAVAPALGAPAELVARYRELLPFQLTDGQEQAIREIDADLAGTVPMQRLLQGDVGSGKTVVALYSLLRAVEHGRQGALMAPTETLAEQHFLTVEEPCRELGVRAVLLTSSLPAKEHAAARAMLASGEAQLGVGTHALIQQEVEFADLAVAVVDEQHRFGVEQRKALAEGRSPHVLHMTATPIPRTLALTVYGDLAVSEIPEPPASRIPIITAWVGAEKSSEAYVRLRRHLDDGRQAYVVCPLIEESETSQARAAEAEAHRLIHGELSAYRVGLLHGRLRPAERRELMASFKARELDVLVATTVIEVGVDVPNATIMIIQEADRFGLAQLHQLRGRVGRGVEQSYCLLVSRPRHELTEQAARRLQALVDTTDGFALADIDLELRGTGQLLGTKQSGLSDLRFARLTGDRRLLERARAVAAEPGLDAGPLADEVDALFAEGEPAA